MRGTYSFVLWGGLGGGWSRGLLCACSFFGGHGGVCLIGGSSGMGVMVLPWRMFLRGDVFMDRTR
jgi:hypothetical protein